MFKHASLKNIKKKSPWNIQLHWDSYQYRY